MRVPRWAAGVVAAVIAWNLVLAASGALFGAPSGPRSSSFATSPHGLAAYSELLQLNGHAASAARTPGLDPRATAVLADPESFDARAAAALRRFVHDGGRLVAGGRSAVPWLERVVDDAPRWAPSGRSSFTADPSAPETSGVRSVATRGGGAWADAGSGRVVAGTASSALMTVDRAGAGTVVALADVSALHNANLARADNAALGLVVAGEDGRPVTFVETVHGYGARGWAAIPSRWRWTAAGLGAAALAFMWARGRRLGPPERPARALPPPRRAYVDALAGTLARTKERAR